MTEENLFPAATDEMRRQKSLSKVADDDIYVPDGQLFPGLTDVQRRTEENKKPRKSSLVSRIY